MFKSKWKLPVIAVLLFLCVFALFLIPAGNASADSYFDDDNREHIIVGDHYCFRSVDVKIDVRRDKTFAVEETLVASILRENTYSYVIRDIQRISQTTRVVDGKFVKGKEYIANISDVNVTLDGGAAKVTKSLYDEGQFHAIKMQTPDERFLTEGDHTYVLSYVYDMGDDKVKGFDDFTFDVLGYNMAFTDKFHAEITFPTEIDASKVLFRTNDKAGWKPDERAGESVEISGNTINITAFPKVEKKG